MWVTRLEGGPRKVNHAAAVVDEKIYCFGGYCSGEDSSPVDNLGLNSGRPLEVSVLRCASLRWKLLTAPRDIRGAPYDRYGHTAVAYGEEVLVWGGRNDAQGACNSLFVYLTTGNSWTRPDVWGHLPQKRDGHTAAVLNDDMYIFGGFEETADRFSSDLYRLHIPSKTWFQVELSPLPPRNMAAGDDDDGNRIVQPMPRDFASLVSLNGQLLLWGGRGDVDEEGVHTGHDRYENVLYRFDVDASRWSVLAPHCSQSPPPRRSHAAFSFNGCMYVFGGFNGRDHFNDLWSFDPTTHIWTQLNMNWSDPAFSPCPRRRMCCVALNNRMYLFGGTSPVKPPSADDSEPEDDDAFDEMALIDHDDLFVLEFMPRLLTLAQVVVRRYKLPWKHLPLLPRMEILVHSLKNDIAKQKCKLRHPHLTHSG